MVREATGTLNHAIKLAAPTPVSPADGSVTDNKRPSFDWTAPPSAGPFTYNLVVEDSGATVVLNETGIGTESFTPASDLPDGMLTWQVQADDGVNVSPFSSSSTFELDSTPPATTTLSGSVPPGFIPIPGSTAISSSGEIAGFEKEKAVDGNAATFWSTPGRTSILTEHITLDIGVTTPVAGVEMTSRSDLGVLFPKDFNIQVSTDNVNWLTVRTEADFAADPGTAYIFDFTSTTIRYIRIEVTESAQYGNKYYLQLAEVTPLQAAPVLGTLVLSWNAPSEDGTAGGAVDSQDIRYSLGLMGSFDFGTATEVPNEPVPAAPGTPQSVTVDSLLDEAT